jgi:hypothetical protein
MNMGMNLTKMERSKKWCISTDPYAYTTIITGVTYCYTGHWEPVYPRAQSQDMWCLRSLCIYHHYYMGYFLIHWEPEYPRAQSQGYVVAPHTLLIVLYDILLPSVTVSSPCNNGGTCIGIGTTTYSCDCALGHDNVCIKHIYNLGKHRVAASICRRAYILLGSHWDEEELKMHHFFDLSIFVRFIPMFIYIFECALGYTGSQCNSK